jgi:hypothetical protein
MKNRMLEPRSPHRPGRGGVGSDAGARTLRFSTPGGQPIPEVPAPPAVPPDATRALVATHRARGLAIDARTGCPNWHGERLDLGWAIGVLHPATQPAAPRLASRSP